MLPKRDSNSTALFGVNGDRYAVEMPLPQPRTLNPADVPSLRWGVLGPGGIAAQFVHSVLTYGSQQIVAVASRDHERATEFAASHHLSVVHPSYQALCDAPDIDAVYISTHIAGHLEIAEMAIRAGKHALVEKPLHYSPEAAADVLQLARESGVLVTEAMWTRYLPQSDVISQLLDQEEVGAAEAVHAVFAVDNRHIPRLWQPGTGSITYDMGIYPIAFAYFVLGEPAEVWANGLTRLNQMDEGALVRLNYDSGASASLLISGTATHPSSASISTEHRLITLEHPFFVPTTLTLSDKDLYFESESWTDESAAQGHDGLYYQAEYFARFVSEGLVESPLHSHQEIVSNLRVADEICRQLGAQPGSLVS